MSQFFRDRICWILTTGISRSHVQLFLMAHNQQDARAIILALASCLRHSVVDSI